MNNSKFYISQILLFVLLLSACDDESPEVQGISSITGQIELQSQQIKLIGGLIEYKSHKDSNRGTYHEFKISDLPIDRIDDTVRTYIYSREKVTILFAIDAGSSGERLPAGSYLYTQIDPESSDFPLENVLFQPQIWRSQSDGKGGASSISLPISGGKVIITGAYPDFRVEGDFTLVNGESSTFYADGTFVTQENYASFKFWK